MVIQIAKKQKTQPNKGRIFSVVGLVCAVISLLFIPVFFGPAAIVFGVIGRRRGDLAFGLTVIILGAVFMVIGMILGALVSILLNWDSITAPGF